MSQSVFVKADVAQPPACRSHDVTSGCHVRNLFSGHDVLDYRVGISFCIQLASVK